MTEHVQRRDSVVCGQNFVAVAHIRIDHLVLDIGPGKGNIAAGKCVIESDRILGRSKGHQYFDIRAVVRSWYPAVPLVDSDSKLTGSPLIAGCAGSSMDSVAGRGGQLVP